jgi:hypothetical protein
MRPKVTPNAKTQTTILGEEENLLNTGVEIFSDKVGLH